MKPQAHSSHSVADRYRLGIAGLRQLIAYAVAHGLEKDVCLREAAVTAMQLADPDAEIEAWQELKLIQKICETLGQDFNRGFDVGLEQHLSSLGILGLGIMSAANGRQAAEWSARFTQVGFPLVRYQLKMNGVRPVVEMLHDHLPPAVTAFLIGRDLAMVYNIHQDLLSGHPIGVSAIELALPWHSGMERAESLYGCELQVGKSTTRLFLRPDILQLGFSQANAFTQAQCERRCQETIDRRRLPGSLTDEIRSFLQQNGNWRCSFREVAVALNLSERNARRRLREEGTGWRQVRETVLIEYARERLLSGEGIPQVADELGYTEASSFSHAFKRWTGLSPAQFCQNYGERVRAFSPATGALGHSRA